MVPPAGYTACAIANFNQGGSQYALITKVSVFSDTVTTIKNTRSSTTTGTFSIRVMYVKTDFVTV